MKNKKIIVILGPTSAGKTGLGVRLAYKFDGEIVSADSRQVYKGMDVGTGKDLGEYVVKIKNKKQNIKNTNEKCKNFQDTKIKYHLIDVVKPNSQFSLAKYKKLADRAISDIIKRGKTPIIVGGSGLYLQALVDDYKLSAAKPDKALRARLEKLPTDALFDRLEKLNSCFARRLNLSDKKNKRRLIRYLEIFKNKKIEDSIEDSMESSKIKISNYDYLIIGLTYPRYALQKRIYQRLLDRLEKEGLVAEVERLRKDGISWQRLEEFGLEYKYVALYLQGKLNYKEMVEKLNIAIRQFAKRQLTWFRRWEKQGAKIHWVKNKIEAERLVEEFLLR